MRRFHALEWEDLRWFPNSWRDYGTDYLMFIATRFDIYKPIVPFLKKGIESSGSNVWVDCASGGGGSVVNLADHLKKDIPDLKIVLTDFYPNQKAFERTKQMNPEVFTYETTSVDARSLPNHLRSNFRTLFGSFHHFRPTDAQKILQDAVDQGAPIGIFEPVGRNLPSFISMLFVILNVLILTPFIRPVRWTVLPFIYLIPIIPLFILWDGLASIFRIYSEKELKEMVSRVSGNEKYNWEIGKIQKGPSPIYYLLGTKKTEL